eukprot:CAMPEP_0195522594 /NCGR_PEP_ID=MMETSP0794_2-20130614/20888_1 /TAXON_ID=515487 /ORGANISM="Stephanopyxis turris, Strain CCMP 815" /LENGTH=417 /DNA_ID=CAMNT_0040652381 /DNA_START=103 /DNA_END=1356 /DNA_ORIENTATION=-
MKSFSLITAAGVATTATGHVAATTSRCDVAMEIPAAFSETIPRSMSKMNVIYEKLSPQVSLFTIQCNPIALNSADWLQFGASTDEVIHTHAASGDYPPFSPSSVLPPSTVRNKHGCYIYLSPLLQSSLKISGGGKPRNTNQRSTTQLEYSNGLADAETFSIEGINPMLVQIPKPVINSPFNATSSSEAEQLAATDVCTLRNIFGTNKNKLWGDLDPETTRVLYHTLLPRALLRLHAQGLDPHELAPLAYEARIAAKKYARERSRVPGRVMAVAFDGFRHLKAYGKWSSQGLSWDEIWDKYECQIKEEVKLSDLSLKSEDLTSRVCLRILERSCNTNGMVDRLVLGERDEKGRIKKRSAAAQEVLAIADRYDQHVHDLLKDRQEKQRLMRKDDFIGSRFINAAQSRLRNLRLGQQGQT